jgi:6-phosphogluconolactonase (cycloisomerase 2 family)
MVTLVNRAKVGTATTGTGTITLGSAESGYQTFADAGVVDTNVVRYVIEDGDNFEIGTGTYTATGTTLSRTVTESSNSDAALNLTGSAVVYVTATAADFLPPAANVTLDDTGLVVASATDMQDFADKADAALLRARGTGVTSTYVSTVTIGGTTFAQPAVNGEIHSDQGYFDISYAGATGITVATLSSPSTYVYIDNAGNLQQQTSTPTRQDWSRKIFTMRIAVDTDTSTILGFEYLNNPIGHYANSIRDLYKALLAQGVPFKEGQTITGRAGDLGFDVAAGSVMEFGGTGDIHNANTKAFTSSANVTYSLLSRTAIVGDETNLVKFWDNAGTITALGSTTVVGHRLYRFSNGQFAMQYGQGNYANITLARAGVLLEDYELNSRLLNATFFGWWLIQETATNTLGTDNLTDFREYTIGVQGGSSSSLAGCLLQGNNLSDLLDAAAARDNLELGDFPTTLGTAGQVLTVNAGATAAEWAAAGGGGGGATLTNYYFTATAGQTSFSGPDDNSNTLSYTADNLILNLNGVTLEDGTDYTATNGTAVVLSVAASLNDELNVIAFSSGSSSGGDRLGTVTANDVDLSTGNFFAITANNQTLSFSNAPAVHDFKFKLTGANVTSGFDLANSSYDGVSVSVSSEMTWPIAVKFKPDGTKMYVFGNDTQEIFQYTLDPAWDIGSRVYDSLSFPVSFTGSTDIALSPAGDKLFALSYSSKTIRQYTLGTAWEISTASYDSVSYYVGDEEGEPTGLHVSEDGENLYIFGQVADAVFQYTLTTGWDLGTTSSTPIATLDTSARTNWGASVYVSPDGLKMYIVGGSLDVIFQYTLTTAFDISTASYDGISRDVTSEEGTPNAVTFKPDGFKMYVVGKISDAIFEYSVTSVSTGTITYPDSVKFSGNTQPAPPANAEVDIISLCTIDSGTSYDLYSVSDNQS